MNINRTSNHSVIHTPDRYIRLLFHRYNIVCKFDHNSVLLMQLLCNLKHIATLFETDSFRKEWTEKLLINIPVYFAVWMMNEEFILLLYIVQSSYRKFFHNSNGSIHINRVVTISITLREAIATWLVICNYNSGGFSQRYHTLTRVLRVLEKKNDTKCVCSIFGQLHKQMVGLLLSHIFFDTRWIDAWNSLINII